MTAQEFQFCPRCGTALVAGLPYCPKCGYNVDELRSASEAVQRHDGSADGEPARSHERRPSGMPIVAAALIVAVGLVAFALLTRPQPGGSTALPGIVIPGTGGQPPPGVTPLPSVPITGLTIQSPADGSTVAIKDVTVIGLAPPGLTITRDVSLGLDQHATADGTGHWAIGVSLNDGANELVFRIGDDRSTEQRLHVTYAPTG